MSEQCLDSCNIWEVCTLHHSKDFMGETSHYIRKRVWGASSNKDKVLITNWPQPSFSFSLHCCGEALRRREWRTEHVGKDEEGRSYFNVPHPHFSLCYSGLIMNKLIFTKSIFCNSIRHITDSRWSVVWSPYLYVNLQDFSILLSLSSPGHWMNE